MYSYFGVCPNAKESLILFEAVKKGIIPTVTDRLNEEQRKEIVSGAIYIWDESKNPIRRWTDGMTWSNSRVVGGFLEYRESFPDPLHIRQGKYSIKPNGLRKRSIWLPAEGNSSLRLIAYFTYNDMNAGRLIPPSEHPAFRDIVEHLESKPELEETLALLSSGKRRKRSKSLRYSKDGKVDVPSPPPTPYRHEANPMSIAENNTDYTSQHLSNRGDIHIPKQNWVYPVLPPPHASHFYQNQPQYGVAYSAHSSPPFSSVVQPNMDSSIFELPRHHLPLLQPTDAVNASDMRCQFTASQALRSNTLPSPIWIPLVMNSEDRRALKLLDTRGDYSSDTHSNIK